VDCGHILVVDDDVNSTTLVRTLLDRINIPARVVEDGETALRLVEEERPAAVVLDVQLPGMSGYEVCRELRDSYGHDLPIIFLSGVRAEPYDRAAGLMLGADDYMTKPFDPDELLARVRALLRRGSTKSRAAVRYGGLELDPQRRRVTRYGRVIALTSKEFALLEFLISRAPEPVPRSEIIEHVWDSNFDSETNLVEVYINRLRQKLTAEGSPRIIHTVHGVGYCLRAAE
jgi:DNA-binding response OmpR family regulator